MSQQPHFVATARPRDISQGLPAGKYIAQARVAALGNGLAHVIYATAEAAPANEADFFQLVPGRFFVFEAGDECDPTWVRVSQAAVDALGSAFTQPVALARLGPA